MHSSCRDHRKNRTRKCFLYLLRGFFLCFFQKSGIVYGILSTLEQLAVRRKYSTKRSFFDRCIVVLEPKERTSRREGKPCHK